MKPKLDPKANAVTRVDQALDHSRKGPVIRVAFAGVIKSIRTAIDAVGDKIGAINISFRPEGNVIADLDAIHKPDAEIFVVIVEKGNE
jgi:hypothetical protein